MDVGRAPITVAPQHGDDAPNRTSIGCAMVGLKMSTGEPMPRNPQKVSCGGDQGAIVENKRLGAALAFIREGQLHRGPQGRSTKAPRRRDQRDARLFKVG
jgi:hypothetical protein